MDLKITHDIDNNVFKTSVTIDGFGTETLSEDDEKDILKNFPSKVVYRNLTFTKNIKLVNPNTPIVTSDPVEDGVVVAVTLPPLSNKEIVLDENFKAEYKIDLNKISGTALDGTVLTKKELVAYAYCLIYDDVICKEVERIMDIIRSKAPTFEGEEIINI